MAHVQTSTLPPLKSSEVRHPFGLPLGSVRGLMSILICVFFWILLLLPTETPAKAVLAHFFLLGLVLMAFASSPRITVRDESPFLPWLMRLIFVGGSIAVVAFVLITRDPTVVQQRLTPDPDEVRMWWIPFLGSLAGGFSLGLLLRFLLGQLNHVFQSMRAWFSVLGLVLLACELGIFFIMAGGAGKVDEFLHYCQCVTIVIVSAYFGTRA